jgi:hypothetical protein
MRTTTWKSLQDANRIIPAFRHLTALGDATVTVAIYLVTALAAWAADWVPYTPGGLLWSATVLFVTRLLWVMLINHKVDSARRRGEPDPLDALPRLPRGSRR